LNKNLWQHLTIILFVDANGAYNKKQALSFAKEFAKLKVSWFEEPVSSDDLEGLHFVRDHAPDIVQVSAGEYGFNLFYFQHMLKAKAVDILQADVTALWRYQCFIKGGGFMRSSPYTAFHAYSSCPASSCCPFYTCF
jgi:L-alanine-DL-glutamate epimerase-like enolase superfamily enzyme